MPKDKLKEAKHEDIPVPVVVEATTEEEDVVRRDNQEYKFDAERKFTVAYDSRKRYDWEWLTRDLFRRGYQFSRYNPSNRTVILSTRSMAKIPINILWAQMRTIKNQVVNFRPKWEVSPKGKSEAAVNNARYSGRLLDYYFEKLRLRKKIKETVLQGLITSVGGPWQIGYDEFADNGKGEVYLWLLDPFDFFIDVLVHTFDDGTHRFYLRLERVAEILEELIHFISTIYERAFRHAGSPPGKTAASSASIYRFESKP